MLGIIITKVIT